MLRVLFTVLFVATCANASLVFPGRSGQLIVSPSGTTSGSLSFVASPFVDSNFDAESVPCEHVADVWLRLLGLPPVDSSFSASYIKSTPFSRPAALAHITVPGVTAEDVSSNDLKGLKALTAQAVTVTRPHGYTPLSATVSMASGAAPSTHGIVGRNWMNNDYARLTAFSNNYDSESETGNVADSLSAAFDGNAFTLSVSSDRMYAAASCGVTGARAYCAFMNEDTGDYVMLPQAKATAKTQVLVMSKTAILSALSHPNESFLGQALGVEAHLSGNVVSVETQDVTATFSLSSETDYTLFAELQYMFSLLDANPTVSSFANDAYPDAINFAVTSLSEVKETYGADSVQFKAASALVDGFIALVSARISMLYADRAVVSVFVDHTAPAVASSEFQAVVDSLSDETLRAVVEDTRLLPNVYVRRNAATAAQLCELFKADSSLSVVCLEEQASHVEDDVSGLNLISKTSAKKKNNHKHGKFKLQSSESAGNSTKPTSDEVERYQITLWLSVIMIFVLFFSLMFIGGMPYDHDSMLFSNVNVGGDPSKKYN